MIRTQMFLRADQKNRLQIIAKKGNIKSSEIVRKGLDKILDEYEAEQKQKNWITGFQENWDGAFNSQKRADEFTEEIKQSREHLEKRSFAL